MYVTAASLLRVVSDTEKLLMDNGSQEAEVPNTRRSWFFMMLKHILVGISTCRTIQNDLATVRLFEAWIILIKQTSSHVLLWAVYNASVNMQCRYYVIMFSA